MIGLVALQEADFCAVTVLVNIESKYFPVAWIRHGQQGCCTPGSCATWSSHLGSDEVLQGSKEYTYKEEWRSSYLRGSFPVRAFMWKD